MRNVLALDRRIGTKLHTILMIAACLSASAEPAVAQRIEPIPALPADAPCFGSIDPERVSRSHTMTILRRDGGTLQGYLYEMNEEEITLRPVTSGATTVSVPVGNVTSLTYGRIGEHKRSKVLLGACVGAVLGFLVGYAVAEPESDPDDFLVIPEEVQRSESGFVFGLIGAGVGAIVGLGMSSPEVRPAEVRCEP